MTNWLTSRKVAITLSVFDLLSEVWGGYLDAMFVFPVDFPDKMIMNLAAVIITLIFGDSWL